MRDQQSDPNATAARRVRLEAAQREHETQVFINEILNPRHADKPPKGFFSRGSLNHDNPLNDSEATVAARARLASAVNRLTAAANTATLQERGRLALAVGLLAEVTPSRDTRLDPTVNRVKWVVRHGETPPATHSSGLRDVKALRAASLASIQAATVVKATSTGEARETL